MSDFTILAGFFSELLCCHRQFNCSYGCCRVGVAPYQPYSYCWFLPITEENNNAARNKNKIFARWVL